MSFGDRRGGHSQGPEDLTHPTAVSADEIIVDGHQVTAFTGDGIEIQRACGDKRLPLTGLDLGDLPSWSAMPPRSCTS